MEQNYKETMNKLGYTQLVCDIFSKWENVKDEILLSERKSGTGNGTIHVFLGAADDDLKKEFQEYYKAVDAGEDTDIKAVNVKHFFVASNLISMIGHVCQYHFYRDEDYLNDVNSILSQVKDNTVDGLLETTSLFKLSTGSNKLRPYFKQFDPNGVFTKLVRKLLLPNSAYRISLFKNSEGEYAAFWLIGFSFLSDFEADSNADFIKPQIKQQIKKRTEQIIYYGAPGTGKSYKVESEGSEDDRIRTTFHPDTDYSSFVGCYKPQQDPEDPKRIIYKFEGQCFAKAYVEAWKRLLEEQPRNYTLVIEEINRGNCAQIFGDIFQLLDRNDDGFSQYAIQPDEDLAAYLREEFEETEFPEEYDAIKNGAKMMLPPNLSIIATMNTSDQSLFPIDSAFKRRWDWEYIPIQYKPKDENGNEIANKIDINGTIYDWGKFIKAINDRIYDLTHSEDKQLGYFFVLPAKGENITMQRFVSKVIFYLWSDIYKDYAGRNDSIFKFSEDDDEKNKVDHSFNSFFEDGEIKDSLVKRFIEQFEEVRAETTAETNIEDDDELEDDSDDNSRPRNNYRINGEGSYSGNQLATEIMRLFVSNNPNMTPQDIVNEWSTLGLNDLVPHFVETDEEYNHREKGKRSNKVPYDAGAVWVSWHGWTYNKTPKYPIPTIPILMEAVENKWGIKIEII